MDGQYYRHGRAAEYDSVSVIFTDRLTDCLIAIDTVHPCPVVGSLVIANSVFIDGALVHVFIYRAHHGGDVGLLG